jgi:hypothetical protein
MKDTTVASASDFKALYTSLNADQRKNFAEIAGTSRRYIECHLLYARKLPGAPLMQRLWEACEAYNASFTRGDLLKFFYPEARS